MKGRHGGLPLQFYQSSNQFHAPLCRAEVGFDYAAGGGGDLLTKGFVPEQSLQLPAQLFGVLYLHARVFGDELPGDGFEVLHVRAEDDGVTAGGGFDDVLAALTDQAFAEYAARNAITDRIYAPRIAREAGERRIDQARRLRTYFAETDWQRWRAACPADAQAQGDVAGHIFLLSFPRSGTTLLEKALAGHPDVVAMEAWRRLSRTLTNSAPLASACVACV